MSMSYLCKLAGTYLDEMLALNASDEQIHQGMVSFRNKIANEFGDNVIDIYAVLNGRIMAANPWEGDTSYDFSNTTWYKDAVATPGTPVFSNLYKDALPDRTCLQFLWLSLTPTM